MHEKTMLTDLYQLTMNAVYAASGKSDDRATFDLFIRKLPQDWGFFIAAGIEDAIDYVTNVGFSNTDLEYLRGQCLFSEDFLAELKEFKFTGDVYAVKEGTPVMPNTPMLRVTAPRAQAQFLETALLNTINFQTMIASKANRVVRAAQGHPVVDFGLRRAQEEDAAMKGSRATYVGGCVATSNVKAGKEYGIPISGTHAHSFVMSFPSEIDAFRAYVKVFPNKPTLLIDTYDTVQGAKNAARVARELASGELGVRGELGAVRLDSGDLNDLSKRVREILDGEGLARVRVVASNDLNEYCIDGLVQSGAAINGFGVGTEMITAKPVAALPGVYKLVQDDGGAKMKFSPGKQSFPGIKQVYRVLGQDGKYAYDVRALDGEVVEGVPLLECAVRNGMRVSLRKNVHEIRAYALSEVAKLPDALKVVRVREEYPVVNSFGLNELVRDVAGLYVSQK